MRLSLTIGVLALFFVVNLEAQWTTDPATPLTGNVTLGGKAGIGGPGHSSARLRLTDASGFVGSGPYHVAFGPAGAMYWGFRLDSTYNLHLDRQGNGGWAEGFVFNREGNFGIGTDNPTEIVHASKDHSAGTIMRINNGSTAAGAYAAVRFTEGDLVKAEIKSTSSGTVPAADAFSLRITNYAAGPMTFGTNNVERMRIFSDGKIAIGNTINNNPGKLSIISNVPGGYGFYTQHRTTASVNNAIQNDTGLWIEALQVVPANVTNDGAILGAQIDGWNQGSGSLNFATGAVFHTGVAGGFTGTVTNAYAVQAQVLKSGGTVVNGHGLYIHDVEATNDYGIYQLGADDTNYFAGNVIVGTTIEDTKTVFEVKGNAHVYGVLSGKNIKAHYQDVAEWVPATTDLAPGTVVILNRERNNEVMASATAYDTTVAGVVSAQPGISLGVEGEGKEQIATTGRVRVRVDARTAPVRVGDLLVTSDIAGTAMRSEPMDINGRKFHQPGTIIGKALEPLEGGVGEILVLLSMQ